MNRFIQSKIEGKPQNRLSTCFDGFEQDPDDEKEEARCVEVLLWLLCSRLADDDRPGPELGKAFFGFRCTLI